MQYRNLGNTEVQVSVICLGTMTWGQQNTQAEAFEQMDYALTEGVNFFDTAELYSIPPKAETYGRTEAIIGEWIKTRRQRDKIVLATKIAGPGTDWIPHIRSGRTTFNRKNIQSALNASLKRLQTDYVDLYQLHWPERKANFFGQLGYIPEDDRQQTSFVETLQALDEQVRAGKIRYIGLSNETPWGVMQFLQLAQQHNLPRVVSIQNPYNLLNRSYEIGLAEISWRETVGLLSYSPLGFGTLSGKYLDNRKPPGSRLDLFPQYTRYSNPNTICAIQRYTSLAKKHRLDPAQMSLAYVNSRPFLTSTIIGATTIEQLKSNINSIKLSLSVEVLEEIEKIHQDHPNPSP
ncbi:NADP(H)-dependent aldo-keto reductase [Nitrosomonas sp.]|uniref:NADP(H)-dependent aldo-keto reductase n=1 Tax=Nitrosomonas sp. TaxID=42353 RepID=UPI002844B893|nr:NADP(H)-dependent aldo-keto reductase [Nitrosomonas sp.]MDR4514974.1 NADP(H)-dependent aldo-keto reductase [Nitrosomonas sp.]